MFSTIANFKSTHTPMNTCMLIFMVPKVFKPLKFDCILFVMLIPNLKATASNRRRQKCLYRLIMELVSFFAYIIETIIILLCKRLLILLYLTNVHMFFFSLTLVNHLLVLLSNNLKYPLFL